MSKDRPVVKGICPYCGTRDSITLVNYHHGTNSIPYATNVPLCSICDNDSIELRKINNRRYKVVGKW